MNNSRAGLIAFLLVIMFGVLISNLFKIQVTNHEMYVKKAFRQQNKTFAVGAERGSIKDRNGEVLSFTKDEVSFFVDTRMVKEKEIESIAEKFSDVFKKDKNYYKTLIEEGSKNICIERKIPKDKTVTLEDFVAEGLFKEEDYTRVYPNGSLASHILGFVDREGTGIDGIERFYNEELKGKDGFRSIERDVNGRTVSVDEEYSKNAVKGNNVYLTINRTYQKILEDELDAGLKLFRCDSAVGIIMDANTAEILALCSFPSYDPANYHLFKNEERRNRAITTTYEPGSTMKGISMAAVLDKGVAKESDRVNTENGVYKVSNVKIIGDPKYSFMNVREVLEQSNNIGMAKLSAKLSDDEFYRYYRDFGFGNSTSVDLGGEVNGYLKKPDEFSEISKYFMSFGYEVTVTPLQMLTAYCALVNGGILYQPYIVKKITDADENTVMEFTPNKIRRVIKESTSEKIKSFMVGAVEQGTGQSARLENVLVGGKTGTSQQWIDHRYSKERYNTSFIGFLPADEPQLVCLILVDAPGKSKTGGTVAAPIFKKVAQRIVEADINIVPNRSKIKRNKVAMDGLFADINTETKGTSYYNVSNNQNRITGNKKQIKSFLNRSTMPNIKGMSLREVNAILTSLGLKVVKSGNGNVISQSIQPGVKIKHGAECKIICRPGNLNGLN
ncbi:penicillin-binding protein [Bacteroidota bacterium]